MQLKAREAKSKAFNKSMDICELLQTILTFLLMSWSKPTQAALPTRLLKQRKYLGINQLVRQRKTKSLRN